MGLPALSTFLFSSEHHIQYKTFLTQEMLKRGMLATNAFYASICHTEDILEEYFSNLTKFFAFI